MEQRTLFPSVKTINYPHRWPTKIKTTRPDAYALFRWSYQLLAASLQTYRSGGGFAPYTFPFGHIHSCSLLLPRLWQNWQFTVRFTNKLFPRSQNSKIRQSHRVRLDPKCLRSKFRPSNPEFRTSLPGYKRVRQSPPLHTNALNL